jgi:hypothetical protein
VQPKQETFFDAHMMPEENWAYIVERKFLPPMLDMNPSCLPDWVLHSKPNHYRSEASARLRMDNLKIEFNDAIKFGLIEFRVVPKYIGYVPPEDEVWIS